VLFGNIEIYDIENMLPDVFRRAVKQSIADETSDRGRGFVLMLSATPYGSLNFCYYKTCENGKNY
jgi:hypothetical protein